MTGPEHYKAAEVILAELDGETMPAPQYMAAITTAQVHATLALAAATALPRLREDWWSGTDWSVAQ